jgi:hypothetical protein
MVGTNHFRRASLVQVSHHSLSTATPAVATNRRLCLTDLGGATSRTLPSSPADFRHVLAIAADGLAAAMAGRSRFLRCKLVRCSFFMSRLSTPTRNLTLFLWTHGSKSTFTLPCHNCDSFLR